MSLQDHNSVIGCVTAKPEFEYGLKLINPARPSDFTTVNISGRAHCSTLNDLKEFIWAKFPINRPLELLNLNLVDYIEAGHGAKGRKIWLDDDDDDVAKMYFDHEGKRKILLWCYTGLGSKKKERETLITYKGKEMKRSQLKKAEEVDEIYHQLEKKHKSTFKPEQLRTWAHMLHVGTHNSYEEPPNKPFFRSTHRKRSCAEGLSSTPEHKKVALSQSPGRRVNIRSELIDQLKKCSDLVESGAISQEVFHDLHDPILSDIKNL